ncbi:MAG: hypothetical protein C0599_01755, partial [Salinivirgaceae bacterium]
TGLLSVLAIGTNVDSITDVLNINNASLAVWLVLGIVLSDILMSLPFAKLRYENKAKLFSILKIANIILNIGFNVFFFFILPHLTHIGIFNSIYFPEFTFEYAFASNLLANMLTIVFLIPTYNFNISRLDRKLILTIFLYSYPIVISGLAGMINDVGDKFILDFFITDKVEANYAIGIYGANYKIATLMIIFIQMFKFGVEPFFFRISHQIDHKGTYAFVTKAFSYIGLFLFVAIIGYIDLVKHFIDSSYHVGLKIVPYVLLGNFFYGIYYNVSIWFKITDKTKFGMYFTFSGAIITIAMLILLVPAFGYMGAAIATLICFVSMAVLNILMGRKHYKVNYDWKRILILLSFSILLVVLFWMFKSDNLFLSLTFGTVIIFMYLASLFVIDKGFFKAIRSHSV